MSRPANLPSPQELDEMLKKVVNLAKFKAKSSGTYIVYEVDQKIIREYPDGSKFEIVQDAGGQPSEVPFHG